MNPLLLCVAAGPRSQSTLSCLARLLRLPPGVGHDRDARFHARLPWRVGRGSDAAIDHQDMAHAGQRLDLIDVGGLHLAGKHGGLFNARVQHSGQLDIDAEDRLAGDDRVGVNAGAASGR